MLSLSVRNLKSWMIESPTNRVGRTPHGVPLRLELARRVAKLTMQINQRGNGCETLL
jgi:hypothetical protein